MESTDLRVQALAVLAVCAAMVPSTAVADQISATMPVTLFVQPACRVNATPLAFAATAGNAIDAEAQIAVACNGDIPVAVTLDRGTHGNGGDRRLAGKSGYVTYAVFSDRSRHDAWQAGVPVTAIAKGGELELTAYGRIEAGATIGAAGSYSDTIAITVDF